MMQSLAWRWSALAFCMACGVDLQPVLAEGLSVNVNNDFEIVTFRGMRQQVRRPPVTVTMTPADAADPSAAGESHRIRPGRSQRFGLPLKGRYAVRVEVDNGEYESLQLDLYDRVLADPNLEIFVKQLAAGAGGDVVVLDTPGLVLGRPGERPPPLAIEEKERTQGGFTIGQLDKLDRTLRNLTVEARGTDLKISFRSLRPFNPQAGPYTVKLARGEAVVVPLKSPDPFVVEVTDRDRTWTSKPLMLKRQVKDNSDARLVVEPFDLAVAAMDEAFPKDLLILASVTDGQLPWSKAEIAESAKSLKERRRELNLEGMLLPSFSTVDQYLELLPPQPAGEKQNQN